VLHFKNPIANVPAVPALDRKNPKDYNSWQQEVEYTEAEYNPNDTASSITLKLKRSGKTIRRVTNAPPIHSRSLRAPDVAHSEVIDMRTIGKMSLRNAELLYIAKPMCHLAAVGEFEGDSEVCTST